MVFRLLQGTPQEPFALWQITDIDYQPKMGLALDRESRKRDGRVRRGWAVDVLQLSVAQQVTVLAHFQNYPDIEIVKIPDICVYTVKQNKHFHIKASYCQKAVVSTEM